jgi:UDP-GlcNAc3NAcA epimerase
MGRKSMTSVFTIVGARPQFIKAAPISRALKVAGLREILVHTGQHFDALMSDVFFEELDIPKPAHNLEINSLGHGAMTGRMLEKLEVAMTAEAPEIVLIYGDTNSTLAGALAAAKIGIPVAHVEAGLRSFNRRMPEEINRVVADHLSEMLFCPTMTAAANLAAEGIVRGIYTVGDVMYDMTLAAVARAQERSRILETLQLERGGYSVATIHRAENTEDLGRFSRVVAWLEDAAQKCPIVMPTHPRTRKLIERIGVTTGAIRFIDPLGYLDMTQLVHSSTTVFTDSGGLQKEAYFHRVPCVTLRDETEWVETIEAGWNRLWTEPTYSGPPRSIDDYGDGRAAEKIVEILASRVRR